MPAAFSRLQLAAALLEYDNDPHDPSAPYRSAKDSAIFAHLRNNPAARPELSNRRSDYLGVSLPSETGSLGGRESVLDNRSRISRGSIDALRNPFGATEEFDDEDERRIEENDMEVDLTSWGLDAFIPKDKSKSSKKERRANLPVTSVRSHHPSANHDIAATAGASRRALGAVRSMSLGGTLDFLNKDGMPVYPQRDPSASLDYARPRSISTPIDYAGVETTFQHHHNGSRSVSSPLPPHSIPFPTTSIRSVSPNPTNSHPFARTFSVASMDAKSHLEGVKEVAEGLRKRALSNTTMGTVLPSGDNPFALEPPKNVSRFDPKANTHARTVSNMNLSMASRNPIDNDDASVLSGEQPNKQRRYSTTLELLRPKVLVMPSPLQPVTTNTAPQSTQNVRDGFEFSRDGPPLPPGARTSRRLSSSLSAMDTAPPIASNSFIPNPLVDLSLSQKTFRNTLANGGQSDVYQLGDVELPRATEDGEQIQLDPIPQEEILAPVTPSDGEMPKPSRPPGKLYGKSLIDDLQYRKAEMRSKQRVFTGDQRPSMMAREQRSSTLIDPASLQIRPNVNRMTSYGSGPRPGLSRQNSLNAKPLLNFDDEDKLSPPTRLPDSRSVFGVDTLWEREMVKLREIQAQEKRDDEERKKQEEEEEMKREEKEKRKKRKDKKKALSHQPELIVESEHRVSSEPPMLPYIQPTLRKAPQPPVYDDSESGDDSEDSVPTHVRTEPAWHADSSDDEGPGPRRTTGIGPRYPAKNARVARPSSDSDEDLPLSVTLNKAAARLTRTPEIGDSSDEEKPLSFLLQKKPTSVLPSLNFDQLSPNRLGQPDDDDDQPLGLRVSRIPSASNPVEAQDDDDKPLAFHPEQQRRTQYQMMAQQQMIMQAQLQNSMFFTPSVMGSGFYPTPMMNPLMVMQPPLSVPSPPPMHDEAKYGRVDRWRHDVAVEGEKV